eukprot:1610616-Rhodomonas_salina.1
MSYTLRGPDFGRLDFEHAQTDLEHVDTCRYVDSDFRYFGTIYIPTSDALVLTSGKHWHQEYCLRVHTGSRVWTSTRSSDLCDPLVPGVATGAEHCPAQTRHHRLSLQ